MKEQLIKELVKTGKEATTMNRQYEDRIINLEKVTFTSELVAPKFKYQSSRAIFLLAGLRYPFPDYTVRKELAVQCFAQCFALRVQL